MTSSGLTPPARPIRRPRRPAGALPSIATAFAALVLAASAAEPGPTVPPRNGPAPKSAPPSATKSRDQGRTYIFFPPQPPRLWAPLPGANILVHRVPAPPGAAEHVGDPFYAPLATRLRGESLTPALREKLENYRREADALRTEMRLVLNQTAEAEPHAREQALAALAAAQAPRLAALEATAESLREELIRGRDHWGALREWRLGSTRFSSAAQAMSAQYQVLRAAAYYQKGLSPAQRRLLREIALDMENLVDMPLMGNELAADANPLFAFSPETARLRLPSPLTPEVAELVSRYESLKAELKQELRDAIYEEDSTLLWFVRNARLEALARAQESRYAALEGLAERIRKALAAARYRPVPPAGPNLPPAIVGRIDDYLGSQRTLQDEVGAAVNAIQSIADLERVSIAPSANGRFEVRIALRPGPRHDEQLERVKERLNAFNKSHAERLAALDGELERIRQAVLWLEGEGGDADEAARREAARTVDAFFTALEQRERLQRYAEYEIAVLEPGLSPEQRRLLFSAALAHLDLPLPGGVPQPTEIGSSPRPAPAMPSTPSVPSYSRD